MSEMRRKSDRVRAQVPVQLKDVGGAGVTVDMSATGVYFVTDAIMAAGQSIRFSIEFQNAADPTSLLYLECVGEVARVESVDGKLGAGIRITESRLERRDRRSQDDRLTRLAPRAERRRPWERRVVEPETGN